jgi:anti-anti-sigma regulatory factor
MNIEVHTRRRFGAREEDVAGWHVLRVTGEVGAGTAGLLPTLDLTALERVDRSGAEALRRCTHAARYAGGRLAMIEPDDPDVAEALEDSGAVGGMQRLDRDEHPALGRGRPRRGPSERVGATRPRRRSDAR